MKTFKYTMEKEIFEQPQIISNLLNTYISKDNKITFDIPEKAQKICFVASGSSYHCGVIAAEMMKTSLGLDAEAFYSGEFYMSDKANWEKRLFVFISQSGETSDTLKVLNYVKERTDNILCISNTENSTIWNLSKYKIHTMAGREESIASTKALSAQMLCVILLILGVKQKLGEDITKEIAILRGIPEFLEKELLAENKIEEISKKLVEFDSIEILGSRIFYGLAKEGALKIKETSYINTTAYPTGEFMHGHVAILNRKSAVMVLVDKINHGICIKNIEKIKQSYSPYIVTFADLNAPKYFEELVNDHIAINTRDEMTSIFGMLIFLQLTAFNCAKLLNRNIDKPTGLSKVVKA
ncbi:MAG: SIS domain-containing protein [Candidatus Gastranaerophilales bacterium]|nr:SIS domain-containing protein [Candidatus Gastranaerophilales bacterium]